MGTIERWAEWLAEQYSGVTVRRDPEPVDVCRWHRELATDIVLRIDADDRGAVEALAEAADLLDRARSRELPGTSEWERRRKAFVNQYRGQYDASPAPPSSRASFGTELNNSEEER